MRMKNILNIFLNIFLKIFIVAVIVTGTLLLSGCKKSDEADASYVLTVQMTNGVNGTPVTGSYTYKKDEQVPYNYTLKEAYKNLKVTLDGATVASSGTVTITGNHTLYVTSEADAAAFSLTVSVAGGVDGTPTTGTTYYLPNTQVPYNYTLKENYIDLKVTLDGAVIPNGGAVTILKNSTLSASATLHYDIRGSWSMTESYSDGSSFSGTFTFTGTSNAGTVIDSGGGTGTYTVQGTYITITLAYPTINYSYTGLFGDKNNISGTSKRTIIATGTAYGGSWKGSRNATTSFADGIFSNDKGETDTQ